MKRVPAAGDSRAICVACLSLDVAVSCVIPPPPSSVPVSLMQYVVEIRHASMSSRLLRLEKPMPNSCCCRGFEANVSSTEYWLFSLALERQTYEFTRRADDVSPLDLDVSWKICIV